MDNAQKAIMIGVGLFITIIIISAVLLITNLGTGLIGNAQTQIGTMSTSLQNQILSSYDGKVMTGTEVLSAITTYQNSTEVSIVVYNGATEVLRTGSYYIGVADADRTNIGVAGGLNATTTTLADITYGTGKEKSSMTQFQSAINTRQSYKVSIVKNATNNNVMGIAFAQQGVTF